MTVHNKLTQRHAKVFQCFAGEGAGWSVKEKNAVLWRTQRKVCSIIIVQHGKSLWREGFIPTDVCKDVSGMMEPLSQVGGLHPHVLQSGPGSPTKPSLGHS